jgi:SAM-dependent methyltransferase
MRDGEFRDPRLAAAYDVLCPPGPDTEFFRNVVSERLGSRVLDVGCGTGQLTTRLALDGHTVVGIDPAAASLAVARARQGADGVDWLRRDALHPPEGPFDVALMTSHVAQFLAADDEWRAALAAIGDRLTVDGRIVFDSRDPADRRWERWTHDETRGVHVLADGSRFEHWVDVSSVEERTDGGALVTFVHSYRFDDGDERESTSTLAFRPAEVLRADVADAGFTITRMDGGWRGEPLGHADGEIVVIAHASREPGMLAR